ncbi:TPA: ABC transporter ATP-binding protein [Pseudomonas aeruginosa]|nr:ABC transporter ATP-binding protein [Pseudomonas aeruginosa]
MLRLVVRLIDSRDREKLERSLRWLFTFVRPHLWAIVGLLCLSITSSVLVLAQPWLTKMLIDEGVLGRDFSRLLQVAIAMVLVGIFGVLLGGASRYLHTRLSGRILFNLRDSLYSHLQSLSPAFYGRRRIGDLMSRLDGDVAEIQRFSVDALFTAVSSIIGLLGAVTLMVVLSWQLSLLLVVLVPLEVLWLRMMRRRVATHTRGLRERSADVSSFLVETLPSMKFIQASGQQGREAHRLEHLGERYMDQLLRLQVIEFFTHAIPGTATSLSRAAAFIIGGYWVIQGSWQLGALIAFSTYLGMAVGPVQSLLGLYVALQRMSVSLERVMELRDESPAVVSPLEPQPLPVGRGELFLDDVWFRYDGRQSAVLCGIQATIPPGSKVALSGSSGAGKSTLIDLLQRFQDPEQGRILLDGIDLRELDLSELRRAVAVVSQDIVLFRGSLASNLVYAAPNANRWEIEEAARLARLDELIATLPQGLDSPLGERGQQLSGGQKQRVAIARALLQKPRILVLDEATSAVDELTEQEVIAAIDNLFGGWTRILISHRASTLANADVHLELHEGKLRSFKGRSVTDS